MTVAASVGARRWVPASEAPGIPPTTSRAFCRSTSCSMDKDLAAAHWFSSFQLPSPLLSTRF